ncbi:Histone acetyltransferase p300 [Araneus ventricosus]|uniref:histone acetyltransferase n=1 Tax=Araneus ventricosus TaxID=182803 RepID=A0A4Y2UPD7_ARAVE|nr:Histone acetyltransferase p300 [Araneus ventricosus]
MVTGAIPDNPTNSKDWHRSFTEVSRHHSVQKIVQNIFPTIDISAIFPTVDISALLHKRMINLFAYARRIEGEMYEAANSREEYEHLLDEKVYEIQKELKERHRKMKENRMQQQVAPGLGPILSNNSSAATPTAVGKSKDFSNEKGNLEMIMQRRQRELFKITEEIKKLSASGKNVKEMKAL